MATIIPEYKIIFTYDIHDNKQAEYTQFVMGTLIPGFQTLNLYLLGVYHTVHGNYPARQAEFVTASWAAMETAITDPRFAELEEALMDYTYNYRRKIVKYRRGFQL